MHCILHIMKWRFFPVILVSVYFYIKNILLYINISIFFEFLIPMKELTEFFLQIWYKYKINFTMQNIKLHYLQKIVRYFWYTTSKNKTVVYQDSLEDIPNSRPYNTVIGDDIFYVFFKKILWIDDTIFFIWFYHYNVNNLISCTYIIFSH